MGARGRDSMGARGRDAMGTENERARSPLKESCLWLKSIFSFEDAVRTALLPLTNNK